jgi:hypothetical protein
MARFDPVMKEHAKWFVECESRHHTFSPTVKNYLIQKLSAEGTGQIVRAVQNAFRI